MSHGQPPHIQRIVPCECGSTGAYWHGPEDGAREYYCDRCWDLRECLAALRALVDIFNPDTQAIYAFAKPEIETARQLIAKAEGN